MLKRSSATVQWGPVSCRLSAGALIGAMTFGILGGCASGTRTQAISVDGANPSQTTGDPIDRSQIPPGGKLRLAESLVMGSGETWLGRAVFEVPGDGSEAFAFFSDSYSRQGWRLLSALRGSTTILVFMKPDRTATIEIIDGGFFRSATAAVNVVPGNINGNLGGNGGGNGGGNR